jgi:hypothetical protein
MFAPASGGGRVENPARRLGVLVPLVLAWACLCAVALIHVTWHAQLPVALMQAGAPGRETILAAFPNPQGEGMTYMPTSTSGVSDKDNSPKMDPKFMKEEDRSTRRMKKLQALLKVGSSYPRKMRPCFTGRTHWSRFIPHPSVRC